MTAFEIMLYDLRDRGANRGEPCGVHDRPQWTCAFCLHNVLATFELTAAARPPETPDRPSAWEKAEAICRRHNQDSPRMPNVPLQTVFEWLLEVQGRHDLVEQMHRDADLIEDEVVTHTGSASVTITKRFRQAGAAVWRPLPAPPTEKPS